MPLMQVGLIDTTGKIDTGFMQAVAVALNVQVIRDLPQFWNIQASVLHLADSRKIPPGIWPLLLVDKLPQDEGGFHLDRNNQPFAKVAASPDSDDWTIDASHEAIEMLVDPHGNFIQNSTSITLEGKLIADGETEFGYLVETCDPCQADQFAYAIQGIQVSDFITPHFYDAMLTPGTRYSFTGAVEHPRQILPGGYISWINFEENQVQQLLNLDPASPQIKNLGAPRGASLREWIDREVRACAAASAPPGHDRDHGLKARLKAKRTNLALLAAARARLYK